jgi:hypothetical protein
MPVLDIDLPVVGKIECALVEVLVIEKRPAAEHKDKIIKFPPASENSSPNL